MFVDENSVFFPTPKPDGLLDGIEDEELKLLITEVFYTYTAEQMEKQKIYGVKFRREGARSVWQVPYTEYRSVDDIISLGYFSEEEKQQIYEDNNRLIFSVYHKYRPKLCTTSTYFTDSDILDACYVGFSKALVYYTKSSPIKFSTYAVACMKNECLDLIRYSNKSGKADKKTYSLDFEYGDNDYYDYLDLKDDNCETEKAEEDVHYSDLLSRLMDGLDEQSVEITKIYYGIFGSEKRTVLEICDLFHISKHKFLDTIKNVREHVVHKAYELGMDASDIFT